MAFDLADLFDGTISCGLKLHLSQLPLTKPYRLETLHEATFEGYQPADFVPIWRSGYDSGYGYVQGYAVFNNHGQNVEKAIGAWLTAPFNGVDQLLSVINPFPGGGVDLPAQAATTLETRWTSFERP